MKIYLAGPLFTEAERSWLTALKQQIEGTEKEAIVVWPRELLSEGGVKSLGGNASKEIFKRCRDALDQCDTVIALLDGPMVDDGTAWEIGYAYAREKRIIGIRTDLRRAGECEGACSNAMIDHACERVVKSADELLDVVFNSENDDTDWFTEKYNSSIAEVERDLVLFYAENGDDCEIAYEYEKNWFAKKYLYSPGEATEDAICFRQAYWQLDDWFTLLYRHSLEEVEQDLAKYHNGVRSKSWFSKKYGRSPTKASGDASRYRMLINQDHG